VCAASFVRVSHTTTVASSLPLAKACGLRGPATAQQLTMAEWVAHLRIRTPLFASHRATVLSAEHVTSRDASTNFTSKMAFLWPSMML